MASDFGDSAARLCGLVCARLGWRMDDFWAATPEEVELVLRGFGDAGEAPLTLQEMSDMEGNPSTGSG